MMMQEGAVKVILLTFVTCGIYAMYYLYKTSEEMNARGADIPSFVHFFIPILNIIWLWKWMKGVEHVTNGAQSAGMLLLIWIVFYPAAIFMVQSKFNEIAGAR